LRTVENDYQATLKPEDKIDRKQSQKIRGRGPTRGKGQSNHIGKFQNQKYEEGNSSSSNHPSRGGELRVMRFGSIGRGRGGREIRCYTCGKIRHMSWNCPKNKSTNQRSANVANAGKKQLIL
jgi:hypothetical protein